MEVPPVSIDGDGEFEVSRGTLRAELAVNVDPAAECSIMETRSGGLVISHQLKLDDPMEAADCVEDCDSLFECGQCHTALVYPEESERPREYLKSEIKKHCICPVLADHDCLRMIRGREGDSLIVEVTVPDREELRRIISGLRDVDAAVSVNWMTTSSEEDVTAVVDISDITAKQEEALRCALEMGYYDRPRASNLGDLAAELDVTESAVSQRLNTAEAKLVRAIFDDE